MVKLNSLLYNQGVSGATVVQSSPANAGDTENMNLIPGLGRSAGERNGNPPQLYFCMENSMDRGAWQAFVHRVTKNQTQLSD